MTRVSNKKNVVKEEKVASKPVNVLNDVKLEETVKEEATEIIKEETAVVEDVKKEVKEVVEATEAKKTAEKKPRAKKETATKTVKKETTVEKKIYVQYAGNEYNLADIEEKVKKAWEEDNHKVSSIKKVDLYIKPEEGKAYYVINEKNAGSVEL